ncbi:hypothetical protein B0H34DRAFT_633984, partial [Crassisporium funariophilum]
GDGLMRIPKLDVSGTNWVIYKDRFQWATDARNLLNHIDGTEFELKDPIPTADRAAGLLTSTQVQEDVKWQKEMKTWKKGEAIVKQQIAMSISDSLFMKIHNRGSAFDIWRALASEFQQKSRMFSVDL